MAGIARYFAEVGVNVDNSQLRKVDRYLAAIEKKFKKYGAKSTGFSFGISKFTVNQTKLNIALGNALDVASKTVSFEISKFVVNQRNLQAAVNRAGDQLREAKATSGLSGNRRTRRQTEEQKRLAEERKAEQQRRREARNTEWQRRFDAQQAKWNAKNLSPQAVGQGRLSRVEAAGMGAVGGGISRLYTPALALGLGGYGLSQLNERNQQIVSSQLTTQAVVEQAGGTQKQGVQAYDWLRRQADQTGFNYLEAAPDFNKLLSGVTGAGMSVDQGKQIFKGFSDLGRVNHIDKNAQNRVFRALSQVAGKDKLMSEELECRLAS